MAFGKVINFFLVVNFFFKFTSLQKCSGTSCRRVRELNDADLEKLGDRLIDWYFQEDGRSHEEKCDRVKILVYILSKYSGKRKVNFTMILLFLTWIQEKFVGTTFCITQLHQQQLHQLQNQLPKQQQLQKLQPKDGDIMITISMNQQVRKPNQTPICQLQKKTQQVTQIVIEKRL